MFAIESLSAHTASLVRTARLHPNLDRLAGRGTYFTHFFANGFSNEGGEISLLTGHVPLHTAGSQFRHGFYGRRRFHRWPAKEGYQTAFFTSQPLLRRVGPLAPCNRYLKSRRRRVPYNGMPAALSGAAEDAALIDRFLHWHDHRRKDKPFMATLLTVESHPPFPLRPRRNDGPEPSPVDTNSRALSMPFDSWDSSQVC